MSESEAISAGQISEYIQNKTCMMGSVLEPFLSGLNFAILQRSGYLPEEIDRLHSCVIGMANNDALSFRKFLTDH